ncbi:MAG: hypothetical protein JWO38_2392 [Gemmataceae bacterium]|nr:hypothetical protein [Gemmataceae bacterium]
MLTKDMLLMHIVDRSYAPPAFVDVSGLKALRR